MEAADAFGLQYPHPYPSPQGGASVFLVKVRLGSRGGFGR
jgi:hypothetical protein